MKKLSWIALPLLFGLAITLALNSRLDNSNPPPQLSDTKQDGDAVAVKQNRTAAVTATGIRAMTSEQAGLEAVTPAPSASVDERLNEIKALLAGMSQRISQLERDVGGLQIQQDSVADHAADSAVSADDDHQTMANRDTDKFPTAAQLQQKQAQQQYYARLEQVVSADVDSVVSREVETSYRDLLASREDWQQHAALESAHCGSEYCKLSVTYSNTIDPQALFELDAGLIFANMDYPASTSRNVTRPDGSIEKILYFAKSQDRLPVFPN